jgi:PEP-CTERM motif-containing protein
MNLTRKIIPVLAAAALMLMVSSVSKADSVCTTSSTTSCSIDLTVTNFSSGVLGTGGNYGTVTLTLDGSSIDVTVTMAAGFGLHNSDFNWNGGTGDTISNLTWVYGAGNPGMPVFAAGGCGGSCDGFGFFGWGFTGGTGSSSNYSSISFTVSQTGGFTSVGQLLAGSTNGGGPHPTTNPDNWFAGQIANISTGCTGWVGNTGSTNSSASGNPGTGVCAGSQVPEPGSLMLFGTGLLGLAGFVRRKLVS